MSTGIFVLVMIISYISARYLTFFMAQHMLYRTTFTMNIHQLTLLFLQILKFIYGTVSLRRLTTIPPDGPTLYSTILDPTTVKESGCSSTEQKCQRDTTKSAGYYSAGNGRIVVGKYYTNDDKWFASVQVDDLIFFNQSLTLQEIGILATTT